MLSELTIKNFAIIDDLTIRFNSGLTILSGETGAGKSIIVSAINLLLGSRATAKMIRTGAETAEIEALFLLSQNAEAVKILSSQGIDAADELLIRRIISHNDRHRIYINGRMATMQLLVQVTENLAAISGQHEHQQLLNESRHLLILDQAGDLLPLREEQALPVGLVGAGAVPPLIGFLADTVSFSFAFSAAGAATLAFLVFLGRFPARGVTPSDGDEGTRTASR